MWTYNATKRNKTRKIPQGVCSCAPALCHQLDGPLFLKCPLFQFLHDLKMHMWGQQAQVTCVWGPEQGREAATQEPLRVQCEPRSPVELLLLWTLSWGQLNTCDRRLLPAAELAIGPRITRVGSSSLLSSPFFIGNAPSCVRPPEEHSWALQTAARTVLSPRSLTAAPQWSQGWLSWNTSSTKSIFALGDGLGVARGVLCRFSFPLHILCSQCLRGLNS